LALAAAHAISLANSVSCSYLLHFNHLGVARIATMSLPRLSFLYPPVLLKRLLLSNTTSPGLAAPALPRSPLKSLALLRYRHGTAVEPVPIADPPEKSIKSSREDPDQTRPEGGSVSIPRLAGEASEPPIISTEGPTATTKPREGGKPVEANRSQPQPTHLAPPPFTHHFDTYSLAKGLEGSGFTKGQAVAVMKGVRGLLSNNLEVARENLVSKSNVENVYHSPTHRQYQLTQRIENLTVGILIGLISLSRCL